MTVENGEMITNMKRRPEATIRKVSSKFSGRGGLWWLLTFVRWAVIIACFCFVVHGFLLSYSKYKVKQRSVSINKNETRMHTYPSVTICHAFKDNKDVVMDILNEQIMAEYVAQGNNVSVLFREFEKYAWTLPQILQEFTQAETGGPAAGLQILFDDSYWKVTVPHVQASGFCHTYNPQWESPPGWWYGIRIGIKLPESDALTLEQKINKLMNLKIYIHEKGEFLFYSEGDYPDSYRLDMSWLKHSMASNIAIGYSKTTSLTRPTERPCTDDPRYDFALCIDEYFSKQRGCQPPWNMHRSVNLPPCTNLTHMRDWFYHYGKGWDNYERANYSPIESVRKTGCPLPCTSAAFKPKFSYEYLSNKLWLAPGDKQSEWVIHFWFENYLFTYEKEYLVCNWTCLLGEIGGNLGFFLGGSILGFVDIMLMRHMIKKSRG